MVSRLFAGDCILLGPPRSGEVTFGEVRADQVRAGEIRAHKAEWLRLVEQQRAAERGSREANMPRSVVADLSSPDYCQGCLHVRPRHPPQSGLIGALGGRPLVMTVGWSGLSREVCAPGP